MTTNDRQDGPTGELPNDSAATRMVWQDGGQIRGANLVGQTVGRYRIKRTIASGGMGTVYEAVQESPRRTVALKVMKHGIASRSALRRFEYEAQILARLRHPGIAQVYEAGTHDDGSGCEPVPYFAMEYIPNAKPITQYARDKKLTTKHRLELFAKVCDAVNHGHQKGIIHRDLKPGNILVDSSGQPKVIDFGVARATDSDMAVTTLQTDVGQLIGTLQYMSPEQCDADPHDIDTRSDVYALGVVLYEMLCEQLPYDVTKVALYEAARVIREEAPTRPSSFNKTLRGDVETIALKALEKERTRRYLSAADFGADITRYLNKEPIAARRASMLYHARSFARRNKALVGGVVATFVVLLVGLVGMSVLYAQAEEARTAEAEQRRIAEDREQEAIVAREEAETANEAEAQRADQLEVVAAFQESQLADIDTQMMGINLRLGLIEKRRSFLEGRGMEADEIAQALSELESSLTGVNFTNVALEALDDNIFERALIAIDEQFDDQPLIRARLLQTVAITLRDLGLLDRATQPQEEALDVRRRLLGEEHPDALRSMHELAVLFRLMGHFEQAYAYQADSMRTQRRVLGNGDIRTIESIAATGQALFRMQRYDESISYYTEAIDTARSVFGDTHEVTLTAMNGLANVFHFHGQTSRAEDLYNEILAGFRNTLGETAHETIAVANNLASLLINEGRTGEALTLLLPLEEDIRSLRGDLHYTTLMVISNLGLAYYYQREHVDAERCFREALEGRRKIYDETHPEVLDAINSLASALHWIGHQRRSDGKLKEATSAWRESLELLQMRFAKPNRNTLAAINNLGILLRERGMLAEAEPYFRESWEVSRQLLGDEHPETHIAINNVGFLLREQGKYAEAEQSMLGAHEIFTAALGPQHDRIITNVRQLAELYDAWHEAEPAPGNGYDVKAAEWRAKLAALSDDHDEESAEANVSDASDNGEP